MSVNVLPRQGRSWFLHSWFCIVCAVCRSLFTFAVGVLGRLCYVRMNLLKQLFCLALRQIVGNKVGTIFFSLY